MQTFLTSKSFMESASLLDSKRLNKQILEGRQLLSIMARKQAGEQKIAWKNHPATLMWENNIDTFMMYLTAHINEADKRGIKTNLNATAIYKIYDDNFRTMFRGFFFPDWYTDSIELDKVITTNQANLYRKEPEAYPEWKWISDWVEANKSWTICCPVRNKKNGQWVKPCDYYWPPHKETS